MSIPLQKSFGMLMGMALLFTSCDNNDVDVSAPELLEIDLPTAVHYGDVVNFTVKANSASPLQNVTVAVLYGNSPVASSTVREADGNTFSGELAIPYVQNIPDGEFDVMILALNSYSKHVETIKKVSCSHWDYPYLTFNTESGETYRFDREAAYQYACSGDFPGVMAGYFATPEPTAEEYAAGKRQVVWGSGGSGIAAGVTSSVTLFNSDDESVKNVTLKFNTLTFATEVPQLPSTFRYKSNDQAVTKEISKGQDIYFEGLPEGCMIDPDFFAKKDDHYTLKAESGTYKITREDRYNYIRVERMSGNDYASFSENGTQAAIWCIGNGEYGKPTKDNRVDWDTSKGLCMAKIDDHKYQLTVKLYLGLSIKFFWQKGWGGEFGGTDYSSINSPFFGVNGSGNFEQMVDGQIVATQYTNDNKYYRITLDTSDGVHQVKLTCEEIDSYDVE